MKSKILLVDDDLEFRRLIEFNLERRGYDIVSAHNGLQGLKMARSEMPDVILLDLMLPDLDGLSVCEILQSQPSTWSIPVFILSALDESWAGTRKSRARFAEYFTKPVDLKLLVESVQMAVETERN